MISHFLGVKNTVANKVLNDFDVYFGEFKVIDQCLSYQDVFRNYEMEDTVRAFYSL